MLNGKMAMAMAAAMVLAALYGCSSSSGIKNDRDRAEAELAQAIMDHAAALEAAAADKMIALEAAAEAAAADKTMALEAAAMAAEEAQTMAVAVALGEAGVGTALEVYNDANAMLRDAKAVSDSESWSVDSAMKYLLAAEAADAAAGKAKVAADANGTASQSAMAQTAVDNATREVARATRREQDAEKAAAITKTAMAHAMAIVNPETSDVDVQPFDSTTADENVTIEAVREGGDVTVIFTIPAGEATSFVASDTPSRIRNWDGSLHMREDDKAMSSEAVSVYTDINAPDDEAYGSYYTTVDRLGVDGMAADDGELDLDEDAVADAAKLYSAAMFPTVGDQIKTYVGTDNLDTEDVDESEQRMFPGSFNSVPGIYACTGLTCEAFATATGTLRTLTGFWTFTPDDLEAEVKGVIPDADYLYFGYWLKTTEDVAGNSKKYTIQTFSGGNLEFARNQISNVSDDAKYSGPAAGVYVQKSNFNDAGVHGTATQGRFTAMANLTATFNGGSAVARADWFSIKGTVENFMDRTGTVDLTDWTVELDKANLGDRAADGAVTGHTRTFSGEATGEDGTWSGAFFGPSAEIEGGVTPRPSGVAGEFTAHFPNGHVAGAFAAE